MAIGLYWQAVGIILRIKKDLIFYPALYYEMESRNKKSITIKASLVGLAKIKNK